METCYVIGLSKTSMGVFYLERLESRSTYHSINMKNHLGLFFRPELQVKKDTKKKDGGHGVSTKVTKVATEAAIVDTMQGLCVGDAAFDEVKGLGDRCKMLSVIYAICNCRQL